MSAASGIPGGYPETEPASPAWTQRSLWDAVHARKSEYTVPCRTRIKVGSWNVAALKGTETELGKWFVEGNDYAGSGRGSNAASNQLPASEGGRLSVELQKGQETTQDSGKEDSRKATFPRDNEIDIYVLGLQEIVDISSPAEALRPYVDPGPSQKWKGSLMKALPSGYELVAEQQLVGLLLLVAARSSIASTISSVSTTSVGTGLFGYMGNKGAVATRFILGESTKLVFINCHLAAGSEKGSLERRNWDAAQISQRTRFEHVQDEAGIIEDVGQGIGDEDVAWWFGDLNYRLEGLPGDDVRRLLMLHTRGEYGVSEESQRGIGKQPAEAIEAAEWHTEEAKADNGARGSLEASDKNEFEPVPALSSNASASLQPPDPETNLVSLATTLSSLLPHDQLRNQQSARKAFHEGWQEGPIIFLPTYKYDVGSVDAFDSSDKRRGPSWCDRILFRTRQDKRQYDKHLKEIEETHRKEQETKLPKVARAAKDVEDILFEYNPETDGTEDDGDDADDSRRDQSARKKSSLMKDADDELVLETYTSHQEITSSDHKPLIGIFTLPYDAVVPELKEQIRREVARGFDKAENEERPGITIVVDHVQDEVQPKEDLGKSSLDSDANWVAFGKVCYFQEKLRSFTVANTSQVSVRFTIVQEAADSGKAHVLPSWLTLRYDSTESKGGETMTGSGSTAYIQPGEAINITLRLMVNDIDLVRALNEGQVRLEHVLVLRLHDGRDHFIPIRGIWMQSSFGRSLEDLLRIPEGGVRDLQKLPEDGRRFGSREVRGSAPPHIFRLTETIEDLVEKVVAGWSMTQGEHEKEAPWEMSIGWPFSKDAWTIEDGRSRRLNRLYVHEALDKNKPPSSLLPSELPSLERLEIVVEVLLDFLGSLSDGIVTEDVWAEMEKGLIARERGKKQYSAEEERAWIFEMLSSSPIHNMCFVFLASMLARVASEVTSSTDPGRVSTSNKSAPKPSSPSKRRSGESTSGQRSLTARKEIVIQKYSSIFADIIFRGSPPARDKDRQARLQRQRHVIQLFLAGKLEEER